MSFSRADERVRPVLVGVHDVARPHPAVGVDRLAPCSPGRGSSRRTPSGRGTAARRRRSSAPSRSAAGQTSSCASRASRSASPMHIEPGRLGHAEARDLDRGRELRLHELEPLAHADVHHRPQRAQVGLARSAGGRGSPSRSARTRETRPSRAHARAGRARRPPRRRPTWLKHAPDSRHAISTCQPPTWNIASGVQKRSSWRQPQPLGAVTAGGEQRGVREHAALRVRGRARGEDHQRRVRRARSRPASEHLVDARDALEFAAPSTTCRHPSGSPASSISAVYSSEVSSTRSPAWPAA